MKKGTQRLAPCEFQFHKVLIGSKEYQDNVCPFGASTVTSFRKRFPEEDIRWINERIAYAGSENGNGENRNPHRRRHGRTF